MITAQKGSKTDSLILKGVYQGKNLYVQNPFVNESFCILKTTVNDKPDKGDCGGSTFELDLRCIVGGKLEIGDSLKIKIFHKPECKPKVLNPQVLNPPSTFEMISIKVDSSGTLKWETKLESGRLPYIIEQFKWNYWVKISEVLGKGEKEKNSYSIKLKFTTGKNIIRLKQVDYTSVPRYSEKIEYFSSQPEVKLESKIVTDRIIFSDSTFFEIFDIWANPVRKGYDKTIDCIDLPKGIYYLNYENKMAEITLNKSKSKK